MTAKLELPKDVAPSHEFLKTVSKPKNSVVFLSIKNPLIDNKNRNFTESAITSLIVTHFISSGISPTRIAVITPFLS